MSTSHILPTGTMANAFATAQIATATVTPTVIEAVSNYNYFDPIDFLDDTIKNPQLKARVLSYMAWKIDMTIINSARNLFWESYKDARDDDSMTTVFEEFIANFTRSLDNIQDKYGEITKVVHNSEATLVKLISIRIDWHTYAAAAASYINKDYKERELSEMIIQDDLRVVTLDTSKIKEHCDNLADGDKAMASKLFMREVALANDQETKRRETRVKLRPCVLATLDAARNCECGPVNFWELDTELQAQLTRAAIAAIESAIRQFTKTASISLYEYRDIQKEADEVTIQLGKVIDKKFSDTVDSQANIDHKRLDALKARRKAAAGIEE